MRTELLAAALIVASLPRTLAAQPSTFDGLKPAIRARVTCSIQAATRFALPANLLIAVAEQEGGRIGQWVKNTNGSYDIGPMQFNSAYLRSLERFGITAQDVEAEGCYPYELAAWRLHRHLHLDTGDLWTRAANYHSRTPALNARYRTALRPRADKWARWLSEHVPTVEIVQVESASSPNPPAPLSLRSTVARRQRLQRASRTRVLGAEPPPQRANATTPTCAAPANVVEEIASISARRRTMLLELVTRPAVVMRTAFP